MKTKNVIAYPALHYAASVLLIAGFILFSSALTFAGSNDKKADPVSSDYHAVVQQLPAPEGGTNELAGKIVYPALAFQAGFEGKVMARAFIDENGTVTRVDIIKGIGAGCDEAVINAIDNTKFTPGLIDGKPVKSQIIIPVTFKLYND